jgi:hypothetical protein
MRPQRVPAPSGAEYSEGARGEVLATIGPIAGPSSAEIEVVRGELAGPRREEVLAFWREQAGFTGPQAEQRLSEVVCLARRQNAVIGVSSVFADTLDLVGGRRFWIFRCLLAEDVVEAHGAMVTATFNALDAEGAGGPEGLCLLLDEAQRRRRPEAEWSDPRLMYAGYLKDGRQIRIAYFSDQVSAATTPEPEGGWRPDPGYEIAPFDAQSAVSTDDVLAAWMGEGGLPAHEAQRRLGELLLVASDSGGSLAGVATAYLARNEQLGADMWHLRAMVLRAHRMSNIAVSLAVGGRSRLVERFVSGEEGRGLGVIFEVENEGLKRAFPKGIWMPSDVIFIGESPRGADVRVHYFPGVPAPEPETYGSTYV